MAVVCQVLRRGFGEDAPPVVVRWQVGPWELVAYGGRGAYPHHLVIRHAARSGRAQVYRAGGREGKAVLDGAVREAHAGGVAALLDPLMEGLLVVAHGDLTGGQLVRGEAAEAELGEVFAAVRRAYEEDRARGG